MWHSGANRRRISSVTKINDLSRSCAAFKLLAQAGTMAELLANVQNASYEFARHIRPEEIDVWLLPDWWWLCSCWIEESWSTWFLSGPVCFSMLANAIFLVNIVRVLVTKLRAPSSNMGGTSHQPLNPIRRQNRPCSPGHQTAEDGNEDAAYNGNGPVTRQTYQEPTRLTTGAAVTRSTPSLNGLRKAVR